LAGTRRSVDDPKSLIWELFLGKRAIGIENSAGGAFHLT